VHAQDAAIVARNNLGQRGLGKAAITKAMPR
jgi:hypothetical protein